MHSMDSRSTSTSNHSKVAVCVVGFVRSFVQPEVHSSLANSVYSLWPHAHLFGVVAAGGNDTLKGQVDAVNASALAIAIVGLQPRAWETTWHDESSSWASSLACVKWSAMLCIGQWGRFARCLALMQETGHPPSSYDWIVKVRPDLLLNVRADFQFPSSLLRGHQHHQWNVYDPGRRLTLYVDKLKDALVLVPSPIVTQLLRAFTDLPCDNLRAVRHPRNRWAQPPVRCNDAGQPVNESTLCTCTGLLRNLVIMHTDANYVVQDEIGTRIVRTAAAQEVANHLNHSCRGRWEEHAFNLRFDQQHNATCSHSSGSRGELAAPACKHLCYTTNSTWPTKCQWRQSCAACSECTVGHAAVTVTEAFPTNAVAPQLAVPQRREESCAKPAVTAVLNAYARRWQSRSSKLLVTQLAVSGGGLGNEFNGLLHSFLAALLTNRSLLVDPSFSNVAKHLDPPELLGGWALERRNIPAARKVTIQQLVEVCANRMHDPLCASEALEVVALRTPPTSDWLRNRTSLYLSANGWGSVGFETLLGCASRRLLHPAEDVRRAMQNLVADTSSALGLHLRGSDRHMAEAAQLVTRGPETSRVPVGRRLALNFEDRQGKNHRHCLEDYELIATCLAERLPVGHAVFVASDAAMSIHALEAAWQVRPSAPRLLSTSGAAIHTAYGTGGGANATVGYVKALADFFLLTRAATFLPNCRLSASCDEHEATRALLAKGSCLRGFGSSFAFHVRNFRVELDMPSGDLFDLPSICAGSPAALG